MKTDSNQADASGGGYGYGWGLGRWRGAQEIMHNGGLHGFKSFLLRLPREHFTVVVLANAYLPIAPGVEPDLLAQIDTPFGTFIGDGAYDGEPVSRAVLDQQPDAQVVIPPHKNAVCSDAGDTQRDQHIQAIEQHGRIAWQQKTGYGLRNLVELAMQRYKRIFGNTMKVQALPQQKTEAWASVFALNKMTNLGMPVSVKI